jgi:AAA domain
LIKAVQDQTRRTFESREYHNLREKIHREPEDERRQLLEDLDQRARSRGFTISYTPDGTALIPLSDDRQMTSEEVARLPDEEKERLLERGEEFSPLVNVTLDQIRRSRRPETTGGRNPGHPEFQ